MKVSDHVWTILGFPNIGLVMGQNATLVVDTGLGPRNGAAVAAIVGKLSQHSRPYLTTTHFHPEHAGGEPGFPPVTILIRNAVQQQDMQQHGQEMLDSSAAFRLKTKRCWQAFTVAARLRLLRVNGLYGKNL